MVLYTSDCCSAWAFRMTHDCWQNLMWHAACTRVWTYCTSSVDLGRRNRPSIRMYARILSGVDRDRRTVLPSRQVGHSNSLLPRPFKFNRDLASVDGLCSIRESRKTIPQIDGINCRMQDPIDVDFITALFSQISNRNQYKANQTTTTNKQETNNNNKD